MLAKTLYDRYLCPEDYLDFCISAEQSAHPRFFQVKPGLTCYGQFGNGIHKRSSDSPGSDPLSKAVRNGVSNIVPFNPDQVIDNLRLERYPCGQLAIHERLLKRIYYRFRPYMSGPVRECVQRFRAADWQKKQFPQWPVDTTVEDLCKYLLTVSLQSKGVDRIPFIWFWPRGARGCVLMTHDVETTQGRDFCARLMDIDDAFGLKASFQIVPEERYQLSPGFLDGMRDRGFEVCVQDLNHDGRLFDNREEFERRVARINRYGREYGADGYRSAVLYRRPEWYKDLDFSFDMSIPNVAHLDPQRGGCCTVMPYFIGDVLELPLTTTQDYTLLNVLGDRSIDLWKRQTELILAKNGLMSFIVHPDYIIGSEAQAVYKDLLALLAELRDREGLWCALPGEINRWWRARSQMSIVQDGKGWRIVGEGADRAVLAYASLVNNELVYQLADTQHS